MPINQLMRKDPRPAEAVPVGVPPPRWTSEALLGQQRVALIEHRGEQYRLRLTAAGKLILTK